MTAREAGFLLLSCQLGNPDRKVLTTAQLKTLSGRVREMEKPAEDRALCEEDLKKLGYGGEMSRRILGLLEEIQPLACYLRRAERQDCFPLTRVSPAYPSTVHRKLGAEAPGVLWAKGDLTLLEQPAAALVGSRALKAENGEFAREVGRQAARQGYVLVSGNAKGADQEAQNACLDAGGQVISVVADSLCSKPLRRNLLWLSEEAFDAPFTAARALSRNRIIHCLASLAFAAQSDLYQGGTWDGTSRNLQYRWSPVFAFRDGSPAMAEFESMGATLIGKKELQQFCQLRSPEMHMEDFL